MRRVWLQLSFAWPRSILFLQIRKDLAIKEYWCARSTEHTSADLETYARTAGGAVPSPVEQRRASHATEDGAGEEASEEERQAAVMRTRPEGIYERFRRGLLEYHSEVSGPGARWVDRLHARARRSGISTGRGERRVAPPFSSHDLTYHPSRSLLTNTSQHEREYIESLRESQCLHVYQKHVAEVWRMTYQTPAPSSPRTFIVLLLSREIVGGPRGERCFMNGEWGARARGWEHGDGDECGV